MLPLFLAEFVKEILTTFADDIMKRAEKPFCCDKCGNNVSFIRKTWNAKPTSVTTIFGEVSLPQMQVQCKKCGHKMFITRKLLNIWRYKKCLQKQ